MSKAIDLGKTFGDIANIEPAKPDEKHYPDLYIDSDDPRLADIPDKGECTIRYKVCSRTHREEKNGNGKKHSCSIRMDILSITPPEKKKNSKNGSYGDDARKNFSDYFKDK